MRLGNVWQLVMILVLVGCHAAPTPVVAPTPAVAQPIPGGEPNAATNHGCDEVSCKTRDYAGACCAKLEAASKPADCRATMHDANDSACRTQFCATHADDPGCELE